MTFVYFAVPVYANEKDAEKQNKPIDEIEAERTKEFTDWLTDKKTEEYLNECFGEDCEVKATCFRRRDCRLLIPHESGEIQAELSGLLPKGSIIRQKIATANVRPGNYFVVIDGDGDIEFKNVFKLISLLSDGHLAACACRGEDYGLGDERNRNEKFELFLVFRKYGVPLPDGQCGCWGFHTRILRDVPITALSYEVELDFITSLLKNKIIPKFFRVNLDVDVGEHSGFSKKMNLIKLTFLSEKLKIDKGFILDAMEEFDEKNAKKLSKEYWRMVQDSFYSPNLPKAELNKLDRITDAINCLEDCEDCPLKTNN